jgi:tetratricopeptide (TPR) repeat protein
MSARKETKSELGAVLKEAERAPHKEESWNKLEELASAQQRPDEVAELYRRVLRENDRPELVSALGQRALRFHEEWFGGKADELVEILTRVLELDPSAEWALRRLSVLYTVKERWPDLLAIYDRSLAAEADVGRRRELLSEALRIAKDFVGDADRSFGYLRELSRLTPNDANLFGQLERLLERQGRWADLVQLWQGRMAQVAPAEARRLHERAAALRLEKLNDPAGALAEVAPVLATGHDDQRALALADRILRSTDAPGDVRRQALELLRARHEAAGEPEPIIAALTVALEFSGAAEQIAIHRELAARMAGAGDRKGAIAALVLLLGLEPGASDAAEQLRHLAELEGDPRTYVRGLDAAAGAASDPRRRVEIWQEAARIHEESLGDGPGAVAYFRRILAEPGASAEDRRLAARKLADLLAAYPQAAGSAQERLEVLERLADDLSTSAPKSAERRSALAEVARLSEASADVDRAAGALAKLLDIDAADPGALDGIIGLYERTARWEPLVAALRRRAANPTSAAGQRADLVRIAGVEAAELGQPDAAIGTWREIEKAFGEDTESTNALAALYAAAGRWGDLADLLTRAGQRDGARLADTLARLGEVCVEHIGDPARAAGFFARALQVDPTHVKARAGAQALLTVDSCRAVVAEALALAAEQTGDWGTVVALLEARLAGAIGDLVKVRLLCEAAVLIERRGEDPAAALALYARALPLAPDDGAIERDLLRLGTRNLAQATTSTPAAEAAQADIVLVATALGAAAQATKDSARAVRLRFAEGQLWEAGGEAVAAVEAFASAFAREPWRLELREAVVRASARVGRWDLAAQAALAPGLPREALERTFLPMLEAMAAEAEAWEPLSAAAAAVLAGHERPSEPGLARDLDVRLVRWCEAAGGPVAGERAAAALGRAAHLARALRDAGAGAGAASPDALASSEVGILRRLAVVLRSTPSRALCETLLQIADLVPNDLDPLREAATVALGPLGAEPLAGTILARLLDQATRLLRTGQPAVGSESADKSAAWAVDEIVRLELSRPDRSAWGRAYELLLDATRLPLSRPAVRALRARAAELALDRLKDRRLAISVLRQMVEDDPQDAEAVSRLGGLYQDERRLPELYLLRQEELSRTLEIDRRLALRLELERISAALEERSGRLEVLRANLEEQPGHRPTIDTLARVLEARNRHSDLVDVLADQATRLEERGDKDNAAQMWDWAAQIVEHPLGDRDRAIRAYERVAELGPRPETFEALGRLYLEKGDPLAAAGWLERWLEAVDGSLRTRAALELGGAYLQADKRPRAVACLERALAEDPKAHPVRARLIELYRAGEAWEPLVHALNDGAALSGDRDTVLAYAREAAEVSETRLGAPHKALGALERAVALAPEEGPLRLRLADALSAEGALDRARGILEGLIRESGRRRSRERAALHHRLAQVARAEGKRDEALAHLEQAAEMDVDSAAVLQAIGEVAAEAGDFDRAERAYRALVLLIERGQKGATLLATEVLLRLRAIALGRNQEEKAQDLLESAITDAIDSPEEAQRLGQALRKDGARDVLRIVLDRRLQAATEPAQQAGILAELAEIAEHEGRPADAAAALLAAVEKAPAEASWRASARRLLQASGESARLVDLLEKLAEHQRRAPDAEIGAALLKEAGEIALSDMKDYARAADLLGRVVQLGGEGGLATVEAAYALIQLADQRGAAADRARALKSLARLAQEKEGTRREIRVEALYRLAAAQMGADDTRDQGLQALSTALELSDDVERAFAIVRDAKVPNSDLPRVLPLYERVARGSKDKRMLLDFLERRAALPGAPLESVREGVELAVALGELGRAEALLVRAVDLARAEGDRKALPWALLELGEVRKNSGDVAGAVAALEEARETADPVRVLRLYQEIAQRALEGRGDPAVAAKVFERLWERDPADRRFWEPLLSFSTRLGDRVGVERVARATTERLFDPAERNAVRMICARFIARPTGGDPRDPAIVEILRAVLSDDPTHKEAIELLADVYLSTGNEEGLAELLGREIEAARMRRDVPAVVALSLRLGARLLARDAAGEARDVYRRALESAPADVALLRALASLLSPQEDATERAAVLERLLENESGAEAGQIGSELADLWAALGDEDRVRRTLELAVARANGDPAIFDRLAGFYRDRHAIDRLAALMVDEAERRQDAGEKAILLQEGAALFRNQLGRPRDAAGLLQKARAFAPHDGALLADLVAALDAVGESGAAIEELSRALGQQPPGSAQRIGILETRAELFERGGDHESAVVDRQEAYAIGGESLRPSLRAALERWRAHAATQGDVSAERRAVLLLTDLLEQEGDEGAARSVLADWCYRHPEDAESLRHLVARDRAAERWEAVVESSFRLIEVETGEAQIAAAELLAGASERLGTTAPAIAGLETALRAQPDHPWLFEKLMALYETAGERRKQASLLMWAADRNPDVNARYSILRRAGEVFLKERDLDNAATAFQRAMELRPGDRDLSLLVADVCIAGGKLSEAEAILEEHMRRAAKDLSSAELSGLQHRMAQLAEARGDQAGRLDWLRRAFDTNRKNGVVAVELADLSEEAGDLDLAVKALRAVTLLPPITSRLTPAMAFLRQARIAFRTSDRPRAVIFAKRALQEDPRLGDAVEFLREIGERKA